MSSKLLLITLTITLIMLIFPIRNVKSSAVLIADFSMSRMVELSSRSPFCKMHHDRGDIQRMLLSADQRRVRQVPRDSVLALESVCHDTSLSGVNGDFQGGLGFIYPGTKWCGPGNLASDFSDLGRYTAEDKCCREHDLCPNTLSPGDCRRGLCNTGTFTRSHCDCDARFRRCLQSVNTETANTLGAVFFNVVQVTCFRERNPCTVFQRFDNNYTNNYTTSDHQLQYPFAFERSKFYLPKKINNKLQIDINSNELQLQSGETQNSIEQKIIKNNNKNYVSSLFSGRKNINDNEYSLFELIKSKVGIPLASIGLVFSSIIREMTNFKFGDIMRLFTKKREAFDYTSLHQNHRIEG